MSHVLDFNSIAKYYDTTITTTFDLYFWQQEVQICRGKILELMCGTGRISLPIIRLGFSFVGLDYSTQMLKIFQSKLSKAHLDARLVQADIREFDLAEHFNLIFIGFNSLSEIILNSEKLQVLLQIHRHLTPQGWFILALQNAPVLISKISSKKSPELSYPLSNSEKTLHFSYQFQFDTDRSLLIGKQYYRIEDLKSHTNKIQICGLTHN